MRRLWPDPRDVDDVSALVAAEARPSHPDRPWLLVNMVASLDGAIEVEGRSGALARPADKEVFFALRAVADVVLAGAGTVRAEGYGPPRASAERRAIRRARGQADVPRLGIVTRSLDLDLDAPLFTEAEQRPLIFTCESSPAERRRAAAERADVVVTGEGSVDLSAALTTLAGTVGVVTCEGGPRLNADLTAADLVDEWDLTISPLLVGGEGDRASRGLGVDPRSYRIDRLLEGDGLLLGRWVREPLLS